MGPKKKKAAAGPVRGYATVSVPKVVKPDPEQEQQQQQQSQQEEPQPSIPSSVNPEASGSSWEDDNRDSSAIVPIENASTSSDNQGLASTDANANAAPTSSSSILTAAVRLRVESDFRLSGERRKAMEADVSVPTVKLDYQVEVMMHEFLLEAENAGKLDWLALDQEDATSVAKIYATFLTLEKLGFPYDVIETAMIKTGGQSLMNALDWLCIHTPGDQLPAGFTDKVNLESDPVRMTLIAKDAAQDDQPDVKSTSISPTVPQAVQLATKPEPSVKNIPKEASPARIDAKLRSQILNSLQDDMPDLEDENDNQRPQLPLQDEHALLQIVNDKLKSLAATLKSSHPVTLIGSVLKEISEEIRKGSNRVKEIEATKGFSRNRAEVSYAKMLKDGSVGADLLERLKASASAAVAAAEAAKAATKEANERKKSKMDDDAEGDEDGDGNEVGDSDDDGPAGFDTLFDEAAASSVSGTTSSTVDIRYYEIPVSWKGKTPSTYLRELVLKQIGKSVKVSFKKVPQTSRGFRASVTVDGLPGGERKIFEMRADEMVGSAKMADEFIATRALKGLFPNLPIYRNLPPAYRDLWLQWIEDDKNSAEEQAKLRDQQLTQLFQKLAQERDARIQRMRRLRRAARGSGNEADGENDESSGTKERKGDDERDLALFEASERARSEFESRLTRSAYQELLKVRSALPVYAMREEIIQHIENFQVVIISGETGSGKSTQIPQFIVESMIQNSKSQLCNVICTQPRRISAISIACRVSEEMGDGSDLAGQPGSLVGYAVRLESKTSRSNRLQFCTTGVLLRRLSSDPELKGVSHIVVDEVHERALDSDFLLVLLRRLVCGPRRDLKVILMSATADAERFARYFEGASSDTPAGGIGGGYCPVIKVPGRTFPVAAYFLEDVVEATGYDIDPGSEFAVREELVRRDVGNVNVSGKGGKSTRMALTYEESSRDSPTLAGREPKAGVSVVSRRNEDEGDDEGGLDIVVGGGPTSGVVSSRTIDTLTRMDQRRINMDLLELLVRHVVKTSGDVGGSLLVFLPGLGEIRKLHDRLTSESLKENRDSKMYVLPLHSVLSAQDQAKVFRPAPKGKRKVVLSTNIAETGITLPDVVYVIDACRAREVSYEEKRNITKLTEILVSKANCMQRRGRAGRVRPGVCYHLVTKEMFDAMPSHRPPEMLRLPLEELILRALATQSSQADEPFDVRKLLSEAPDAPPQKHVERALTLLTQIQAVSPKGSLTPLGNKLALLPVDARLGKMLLYACTLQCLDPILTIAASLSLGRGPFLSRFDDVGKGGAMMPAKKFLTGGSDLLTIAAAYTAWRNVLISSNGQSSREFLQKNGMSLINLTQIEEARSQILRILVTGGALSPDALGEKKGPSLPYPLATNIPPTFSQNATVGILSSVLAAGLYPTIIVSNGSDKPTNKSSPPPVQLLGLSDSVSLHNSSVMSSVGLKQGWYTSHSLTKAMGPVGSNSGDRIIAWDVNRVASVAALTASGVLAVDHRTRSVALDNPRMVVKMSPRTGAVLARFAPFVRSSLEDFDTKGDGRNEQMKHGIPSAKEIYLRAVEVEAAKF
ncbi:ATP-dependent RNA helicase dhx29 [Blyttiomyces sp. JEL0837]|nr:ATP-dependent RNA helicase dhx29 [Blyttiomyces sp. JEL0837]